MKTFCNKVCGKFKFSADTEIDFFTTFGFIEVDPELWLCQEYEFSSLPWAMFTPEIGKTADCTPSFGELDSPYPGNLEVVRLIPSKSIRCAGNRLIHGRD